MLSGSAFKKQNLVSVIVRGAENTGKILNLFFRKAAEKRAGKYSAIGTTCVQGSSLVGAGAVLFIPVHNLARGHNP